MADPSPSSDPASPSSPSPSSPSPADKPNSETALVVSPSKEMVNVAEQDDIIARLRMANMELLSQLKDFESLNKSFETPRDDLASTTTSVKSRSPKASSSPKASGSPKAADVHSELRKAHHQLQEATRTTQMLKRRLEEGTDSEKVATLQAKLAERDRVIAQLKEENRTLKLAQHRMNRDLLDVQAQQEQVPSKVESLMNEVKSLKERHRELLNSRDAEEKSKRKMLDEMFRLQDRCKKLTEELRRVGGKVPSE